MSSGERFLTKKKQTEKITINRETLVDIIAAWLYSTRMVNDSKNISNIVFLNDANFNFVHLEIETNGGATN